MDHVRQRIHRIWTTVPDSWRNSFLGRFFSACYHACFYDWYDVKSACAWLARTARLRLRAAGIPLKPAYLVVGCRKGPEAIGLFSEFVTVLGSLEHYERWTGQYAGLRVDYTTHGLYYDAAFGSNWWQYYFEPIELGSSKGAAVSAVAPLGLELFSDDAVPISRERGSQIIQHYIRPRSHIRDKVDSYARSQFEDSFVVGIHYRGTDKREEAPVVPFARVLATVRGVVESRKPKRYKVFLATDEQRFVDYMQASFDGELCHRRSIRSADGLPVHTETGNGYQKGEDAVIDCLLLSRCDFLVRTSSNLSLCATWFNPRLPNLVLNPVHPSHDSTASVA